MRVTHFTDAMGTGGELFGKERVIYLLMHAQRDAGVEARLITFAPVPLARIMTDAGFHVTVLEDRHRKWPMHAARPLRAALDAWTPDVLHSHGYKANIVTRAARFARFPIAKHVATCHGWFPDVVNYNRIDRATAPFSDIVTVTDPGMIEFLPKTTNAYFVANGIPARGVPSAQERAAARARLGFGEGDFVAGVLCRAIEAKGVLDVLECARRSQGSGITWTLAGGGPLAGRLRDEAPANARYFGHLDDPGDYRMALDVYLQSSYAEGLSLSLLEAMRDERAIVATEVNATSLVIRSDDNGLLVQAGDVDGIVSAVRRLQGDPETARRFARRGRERFDAEFRIERQHERFLELYRDGAK